MQPSDCLKIKVTDQRDSHAEGAKLVNDANERAQLEASNALVQFDTVLNMIDDVERGGRIFRLRVSAIQTLHRLAMDGLTPYAGNWRPGKVTIGQSEHIPPDVHLVGHLMEEMCDWVNDNWQDKTALELCAYVMWRLNWIHPFDDGNGRTSRAVSYLVLCAKVGSRLPGRVTIPELIAKNKTPYYEALEQVDRSELDGAFDLSSLCMLIETCLAKQLTEAYQAAITQSDVPEDDRKLH